LALGMPSATSAGPHATLPGVQATTDGPDVARRSQEDRAIETAGDEIARAEARLDAAAAALRLDLPARSRARVWWTSVDPATRARTVEVANRADALATATFAEMLTSNAPGQERLQARAAVIGGFARLLRERAELESPTDWTTRLARFKQETANAPDKTSQLDGPTLLALAAATLAADPNATEAARDLHLRAGMQPEGIDAVEYALIGAIIEDRTRGRGMDPRTRIRVTEELLRDPHPAGDRLLLGGMQLRGRLESGESLASASDATRRSVIPPQGLDATDRVRLIRALATLVAASAAPDTSIADLPPLAALGRLSQAVAAGTPEATTAPATLALIDRAMTTLAPMVKAEVLLDAATLAMRRGEAPVARESIVTMVETLPGHPKALTAAGLAIRLAQADPDGGVADTTTDRILVALPEHPNRDDWLLAQAARATTREDTTAARTALERIPTTSPARPEAILRLLQLDAPRRLDRGRDSELQSMLRELDGIDADLPEDRSLPLRVEADLLRIQALEGLGRSSSAASIAAGYLRPATIPESLRLEASRIATTSLRNAGRIDEANRLLAALAAIEPDASSLIAGLLLSESADAVLAAIDRNDREEARELAETALRANPVDLEVAIRSASQNPRETVRLGWVLAAAGRTDEALRLSEAILAARPGAMEPLHLRAVLLGGRLDAVGRGRRVPSTEDAGRAITDLRRIAQGTGRGSIWWWRAEVEQLEIMVALARNLDRIGTRIERLRMELKD
ncbi:MAG: hypothetical protein VX672_06490, partial [Planctomycetota bacterium]|nr:hypothetical protein [Planctomycetota bacterium]